MTRKILDDITTYPVFAVELFLLIVWLLKRKKHKKLSVKFRLIMASLLGISFLWLLLGTFIPQIITFSDLSGLVSYYDSDKVVLKLEGKQSALVVYQSDNNAFSPEVFEQKDNGRWLSPDAPDDYKHIGGKQNSTLEVNDVSFTGYIFDFWIDSRNNDGYVFISDEQDDYSELKNITDSLESDFKTAVQDGEGIYAAYGERVYAAYIDAFPENTNDYKLFINGVEQPVDLNGLW